MGPESISAALLSTCCGPSDELRHWRSVWYAPGIAPPVSARPALAAAPAEKPRAARSSRHSQGRRTRHPTAAGARPHGQAEPGGADGARRASRSPGPGLGLGNSTRGKVKGGCGRSGPRSLPPRGREGLLLRPSRSWAPEPTPGAPPPGPRAGAPGGRGGRGSADPRGQRRPPDRPGAGAPPRAPGEPGRPPRRPPVLRRSLGAQGMCGNVKDMQKGRRGTLSGCSEGQRCCEANSPQLKTEHYQQPPPSPHSVPCPHCPAAKDNHDRGLEPHKLVLPALERYIHRIL
ncbi:collagen alpha-1(XIII) chain-like [Vulpes lagopus]|uniref:collagen alpha-1(XIII) chain-like n=1 Tax=Vulpes lagopus TaxID=494514 RepID=UPI001BC9C7AD|nr:collagen alpha-1(XIII) chain-like [Vulpes lagopus]